MATLKLCFTLKIYILSASFVIFSFCSLKANGLDLTVNFLPMEDAMSTSRNTPDFIKPTAKPYNAPLSFNKESIEKKYFTSVDFFAFVLLVIVYLIIINRRSKPRNISL